ncbi:transposase [Streptomyces sp. NPDC001212]
MSRKGSTSKRYTAEFKHDAVALVRASGKTVTEVAREIGVNPEGLQNWVNQDRVDRGRGSAGALTSDGCLCRPRTIPGPADVRRAAHRTFSLVTSMSTMYHQQTKNLLVSYSPKKLGFF